MPCEEKAASIVPRCLHKPSVTVAPPQAALPAVSSRSKKPDPSDAYLASHFQETFEQVVNGSKRDFNRNRDWTLTYGQVNEQLRASDARC